MENDEKDNAEVFVSTRKMMAGFFEICTYINLIPREVDNSTNFESNVRCDFLCQGHKMEQLVPLCVQNLIRASFPTMQEGAHRGKKPDNMVKKRESPYLLKAMIYSAFSSLVWLKNFIDEHPNDEKTREITKPLVDTFLQKRSEKQKKYEEKQADMNNKKIDEVETRKYVIEEDENGVLHCGIYYIRCHRDDIGKEVVITKIMENTDKKTNTKYPQFARYEI